MPPSGSPLRRPGRRPSSELESPLADDSWSELCESLLHDSSTLLRTLPTHIVQLILDCGRPTTWLTSTTSSHFAFDALAGLATHQTDTQFPTAFADAPCTDGALHVFQFDPVYVTEPRPDHKHQKSIYYGLGLPTLRATAALGSADVSFCLQRWMEPGSQPDAMFLGAAASWTRADDATSAQRLEGRFEPLLMLVDMRRPSVSEVAFWLSGQPLARKHVFDATANKCASTVVDVTQRPVEASVSSGVHPLAPAGVREHSSDAAASPGPPWTLYPGFTSCTNGTCIGFTELAVPRAVSADGNAAEILNAVARRAGLLADAETA